MGFQGKVQPLAMGKGRPFGTVQPLDRFPRLDVRAGDCNYFLQGYEVRHKTKQKKDTPIERIAKKSKGRW